MCKEQKADGMEHEGAEARKEWEENNLDFSQERWQGSAYMGEPAVMRFAAYPVTGLSYGGLSAVFGSFALFRLFFCKVGSCHLSRLVLNLLSSLLSFWSAGITGVPLCLTWGFAFMLSWS